MGHTTRRALMLTALATGIVMPGLALAQGRGGGDDPPLTLSLAVWDNQGRQSEAAAADLVRLAAELSDGTITIVPTFGVSNAAEVVSRGDADLGILASREWDALGVTSLGALEAPFLVDDDALAVAISTTDIATRAMAGLDAVGVTGLAMWPEDLRHLFAFDASGKVFRTPEDVHGARILGIAGTPGQDLIPTLGGALYQEGIETGDLTGDRDTDASTGRLHGMVTGLWGAGLPPTPATVAGDVVVFSKYQMLVANSAAMNRLTDGQRATLAQVTEQVLAGALDRHFSERDLAAELCAKGATVIEAGPEALAAFRQAAQPLTDALASDPVTGPLMADIAALDASIADAPSAEACTPPPASPAPPASAPADEGFIGAQVPPNGTWRTQSTTDELVAAGGDRNFAGMNSGVWDWTFTDGEWLATHRNERCSGTYAVDGDAVRFVTASTRATCGMDYVIRWRLDGDVLDLQLVEAGDSLGPPASGQALINERAFIERHWQKAEDATGSSAGHAG